MAKIKIKLSIGEMIIEFTNITDLENQLKNIDLSSIESLLERNIASDLRPKESIKNTTKDDKIIEELGTVNLLKISEGGQDATKLAIFLSANKVSQEDVKKITGITILS